MPHIFISYAKKDTRQLAENLYHALNAVPGLTAWMDRSLEADSSWAQQIQNEIDRCDYFVVLLSPDVNRPETDTQSRSFVLNELDYAQQDRKSILPVMVIKTRQPVQIAGTQFIDLTEVPTNPTPIVERVCKRFNLETLEQIRDREAHQREAELAAEREAEQRRFQQAAIEAREREAELVPEREPEPPAGRAVIEFPQHDAGLATEPQPEPPDQQGVWKPQAQEIARPSPGQSATKERRLLWAAALFIPIAIVIGLLVWNTGRQGIASNSGWTPVERVFDSFIMVQVPAGCFDMGSTDGDPDERPVNRQCFEQPFWIDRTEVTQANFERFGGQKANPNDFDGDQRPVERITWFEARDFCALRGLRLPTEREWEYAARGPGNLIYPWGNDWNLNNAIWVDNANSQTSNVGSRPAGASWVGAQDMSGNVWEWVSSLNQDYPYVVDDGREEGDNLTGERVMRGGGWRNDSDFYLRAPYRFAHTIDYQVNSLGFRCARDDDTP
jgi:formylglycine-generating enzyme required for sulfatase activity